MTSTGAPLPKLRFAGQWTEPGSGLYQNWHRTYDPTLGRYLEADPLGLAAGQSLYGYAGQDPVNAMDPEGLYSKSNKPTPSDIGKNQAEATVGLVDWFSQPYRAVPGEGTDIAADKMKQAVAAACYNPPPRTFFDQCLDLLELGERVRDDRDFIRSLFKEPQIAEYPRAPLVPSGSVDQTNVKGGERMNRR